MNERNEQDFESILAEYIDGDLPDEQTHRIEQRLKTDPVLREEVELARFARETLTGLAPTPAPANLAERIFSRTTQKRGLLGRVADWFRADPSSAFALTMVAILAGVVVFAQFGSLITRQDVAAENEKLILEQIDNSPENLLPAKLPLSEHYEEKGKVLEASGGERAGGAGRAGPAPAPESAPVAALSDGLKGDLKKEAGKTRAAAAERIEGNDQSSGLELLTVGKGAPDDRYRNEKDGKAASEDRMHQVGGGVGSIMAAPTAPAPARTQKTMTKSEGQTHAGYAAPPPPPAYSVTATSAGGLATVEPSSPQEETGPFISQDLDNNTGSTEAEKAEQKAASGSGYGYGSSGGVFGAKAATVPMKADAEQAKKKDMEFRDKASATQIETEKSIDETAAKETQPDIVQHFEGRNSGWTRGEYVTITNPGAWAAFWKRLNANMVDAPPLPSVDFRRQLVVGVGLGTLPTGGFSVKIVSARLEGNVLHVRFTRKSPAPGSIVTESMTQPFSLAVVDLGEPVPPDIEVKFEE